MRVLIVDDQWVFRSTLASVLDASGSGFVVVREAHDAAGAVRGAVAEPLPELALVDVQLGPDDGVELCRRLTTLRADLDVVLVSTMAEEDLPADASTCGALGFLSKSRLTPEALHEMRGDRLAQRARR